MVIEYRKPDKLADTAVTRIETSKPAQGCTTKSKSYIQQTDVIAPFCEYSKTYTSPPSLTTLFRAIPVVATTVARRPASLSGEKRIDRQLSSDKI